MGHFDPLIPLRVESGCHLGNLIFNDLEALQVESSAHFDHLIFTEWARRVTDKTEVLKMITPVASLQMKVNMFNEPSTRTRSSFELAEKRLSADSLNFGG